ncbi:MAG: branched-chain amino acid transaminase [Vicinamibacteria bacterium]|nr:branched-chain amino acid transaminase [Vicinamibacteria bacterium]
MGFLKSEKIWMNGALIPWDEAKVHVGSHAIHYASSVFEGIRCYSTPSGRAVFRLPAHLQRLYDSAKVYRMEIPVPISELTAAVLETVSANGMNACYIRPFAFRGYGSLGLNPAHCPIEVAVMVWEWGQYLGDGALSDGVDVCVSSWNRMAPNTLPAMAKTAANYMNSQLIKMEALADGYAEGIALDSDGFVSEGSGENVFLVRHETLYTPALTSSILPGITRDSVIKIARRLGLPVVEQRVPRELLYLADELFFTGTAVEITPIRSVDRITAGCGKRGPVTQAIQNAFFDVIQGRVPDEFNWLTFVHDHGESSALRGRRSNAG